MINRKIISIIAIVVIYSIASLLIDKAYILPSILEVLISLKDIVISSNFITTVLLTVSRTLIGVTISFMISLVLASVSYRYKSFEEFIEPLYIILKTIPNITYIVIALIWFGRTGSILIVSTTVVLPIFYNSILSALKNIDKDLKEYTMLYDYSYIYLLYRIYIPIIFKDILLSISNCLSLSFKVSIMAEILSQISSGIGKELYIAKSNFLTSEIFAWTIIIILISYLFDSIIHLIVKKYSN